MVARRAKTSRPRAAKRPKRRAAPAPMIVPRRRIDLREPPQSIAVCRQCGRMAKVTVPPFDAEQWISFASAGTTDWAIEGISLSITGYCPKCRLSLPSE